MCTEMKTNATVVFFDIEFCASDIFHTNVTPVLVQILGRISWNAVYSYVCGDILNGLGDASCA